MLSRPRNVDIQLDLFLDYADNVKLYPRFQEYFRSAKPRDIPDATVKFLPTGHFALETHLEEIVVAMRQFLMELPGPGFWQAK